MKPRVKMRPRVHLPIQLGEATPVGKIHISSRSCLAQTGMTEESSSNQSLARPKGGPELGSENTGMITSHIS